MPLRLCVSLRLLKSSNALLIVNAKTRVFQHHDRSRLMKVSIRQAGRSRLTNCLPRLPIRIESPKGSVGPTWDGALPYLGLHRIRQHRNTGIHLLLFMTPVAAFYPSPITTPTRVSPAVIVSALEAMKMTSHAQARAALRDRLASSGSFESCAKGE
jgi:hypothetical protein